MKGEREGENLGTYVHFFKIFLFYGHFCSPDPDPDRILTAIRIQIQPGKINGANERREGGGALQHVCTFLPFFLFYGHFFHLDPDPDRIPNAIRIRIQPGKINAD